jgi:RNA polymerase sigma-70 factor (ECF subfamily)
MEAALPPPGDIDQHLLIRALREREDSAFRELLDRHESAMLRLAMSHVGSRARAEEVVQDTWIAVIKGIDRFRGDSSVKTWLFRILLNRARTQARREARSIPFSDAAGHSNGQDAAHAYAQTISADHRNAWTGSYGAGPEDGVLGAELRARIDDALALLPERQRRVLILRDLEGWTAGEVCDLLGISDGNQRVLLHRARIRMRELLEPYLTGDCAANDDAKTIVPAHRSAPC